MLFLDFEDKDLRKKKSRFDIDFKIPDVIQGFLERCFFDKVAVGTCWSIKALTLERKALTPRLYSLKLDTIENP